MSRKLDDLSPRFRPLAMAFLARLVEAGIHVLIVDTLRTPEEHQANLAKGVSWTTRSKHLTGDAMDVVPYSVWTASPGGDKVDWNSEAPVYQKLGAIAKSLGLIWGGDWVKARDMGHVEYNERAPSYAPDASKKA